jgi:hypothetical protein
MKNILIIFIILFSPALYADCEQTDEEIFLTISEAEFLQKEAVVGLRCLIDMPNSESILLRLANSENKLAWLYAVIGLKEINSKEYINVLSNMKKENYSFMYKGSDYFRETTIAEQAMAIEQGEYVFYK